MAFCSSGVAELCLCRTTMGPSEDDNLGDTDERHHHVWLSAWYNDMLVHRGVNDGDVLKQEREFDRDDETLDRSALPASHVDATLGQTHCSQPSIASSRQSNAATLDRYRSSSWLPPNC